MFVQTVARVGAPVPALSSTGVEIAFPNGEVLTAPSSEADDALSKWIGRRVRVEHAESMNAGVGEFFADATDDNSKVVSWTMPAGRFVDALPLLVVTTASLRKGRALHPDGAWETRRFRPNIVIDVDDEGWVEDQWCGRAVHIGTAVVQPVVPCERCTMVTRASARDRACRRRGHAQRLTVAVAMQRARRNCPQRWPPN